VITKWFSARVFTLVFGVGYALAVHTDHPLFRYYPLANVWSVHDLPGQSLGPAMTWYGWIAIAAIPAVLLSALVPKRLGDRLPTALYWLIPFAMFAAGCYHERTWFF
jgi:hypothetical protein